MTRKPNERDTQRDMQIAAAYLAGDTRKIIAARYGVTPTRIGQVLRRQGLTKHDSPRVPWQIRRAAEKAANIERRVRRVYGVCVSDLVAINGFMPKTNNKGKVAGAYFQHRSHAARRGIGWEFTLATWWAVWKESGRWEQRGRGRGYCMARYGDIGPYSPNNVYICTGAQNVSDSYLVKPAKQRLALRYARARLSHSKHTAQDRDFT